MPSRSRYLVPSQGDEATNCRNPLPKEHSTPVLRLLCVQLSVLLSSILSTLHARTNAQPLVSVVELQFLRIPAHDDDARGG
jgi:hypothetical protein